MEAYVDAVLQEARSVAKELLPQTVFIGGGTPSLLSPQLLDRLLRGLADISGFVHSSKETTLEANPESFSREKASLAKDLGITRISLGIQSLRQEVLQAYDRVHDPEQALKALDAAQEVGFAHCNADLIFAFPGQNPEHWWQDLHTVLASGIDHLSAYELSYEPGTALTRLNQAGRWPAENPDHCQALFEGTRQACHQAGFGGYEVSNFAKSGAACLHNLVYWRSHSYVGLGAGAHSWYQGNRVQNLPSPEDYLATIQNRGQAIQEKQRPSPGTLLFEILMMGLRLPHEGVNLDRAEKLTELDALEYFGDPLSSLLDRKWLCLETGSQKERYLRATETGFLLLDEILLQLLPDDSNSPARKAQ